MAGTVVIKALGLETLNWNTKPRVCSRHFRKEDFVIGGNYVKLSKYAVPSTQEPSCGNTQNLPTTSSTDSSTEVSMSWSNKSGNSSKVNTTNKAFNPVSRNVSEDQCYTEDQLNSFISSTTKQRFTNKTIEEAQHFPMDMTWISKENSTAEDKLTGSTSTQMVLSQKSTSHENIVEMKRDNVESETCKCSITVDKLEKEIKYLNKNMKRLQESVQSKGLFNLETRSNSGATPQQIVCRKPIFFNSCKITNRTGNCNTRRYVQYPSCLDIWPNWDILISRASDSMSSSYNDHHLCRNKVSAINYKNV